MTGKATFATVLTITFILSHCFFNIIVRSWRSRLLSFVLLHPLSRIEAHREDPHGCSEQDRLLPQRVISPELPHYRGHGIGCGQLLPSLRHLYIRDLLSAPRLEGR